MGRLLCAHIGVTERRICMQKKQSVKDSVPQNGHSINHQNDVSQLEPMAVEPTAMKSNVHKPQAVALVALTERIIENDTPLLALETIFIEQLALAPRAQREQAI